MTAPIRIPTPLPGEIIAVVRRHQDFVEVFRLMKERLGLTNEFIDNAGGLTKGHADKILGPSSTRGPGPTTFDLFCELFAIEFRVHIDDAAIKRMEQVWEGRKRPVEYSENSRISAKLIEKAKPHVLKGFSRLGGTARGTLLTGKQRTKIAQKAARKSSRLKKLSMEKRREIALRAINTRWDRVRAAREAAKLALELEAAALLAPDGPAALAADQVG